jgi:hypothetical protein
MENAIKMCEICSYPVEEGGNMHPGCRSIMENERYLENYTKRFQNSETGEATESPNSFIQLSDGSTIQVSFVFFQLHFPLPA